MEASSWSSADAAVAGCGDDDGGGVIGVVDDIGDNGALPVATVES